MKDIKTFALVNDKWILILIFIAALAVRLISVMNLPNQFRKPATDDAEYDISAMNLLEGRGLIDINTGLPTSWRVPMYPLFLASIYSVFGHNYGAVRVIQSIMGALLCLILFFIAKEIFGKTVGYICASILTFYQPFIFYAHWGGPAFLFSENLFTFLLALLILFLVRGSYSQFTLKNSVVCGILLGLSTLTRPLIGLFPIFIIILFFFKYKFSFKTTLMKILPLMVSFIFVILPWSARNYFVHRAFIPFSTEGGFALLSSNNPYVRGGGLVKLDRLFTEEELTRLNSMTEVEKDRFYRKNATEFISKNYNKLPKLFCRKLLVFWDLYTTYYDSNNNRTRSYNIWFATVFMFGIVGILKSIKSKLNLGGSLLILLLLYFCIMILIFNGEARFRYPIEPYVIIFASVGILYLYNSFKSKFLAYSVIGFIIAINFLFYAKGDLVLNYTRQLLNTLL